MFKRFLLALALTVALPSLAFAADAAKKADAPKKEQKAPKKGEKKDEATYICPMKCEGSEHQGPGTCPKCGMDLVKKEEAKK
ncbi:MAG TPA: heavy metal-binding domain-containing protein [Myxococcales bacterium]|jgi:opacity protein-like surface antigen